MTSFGKRFGDEAPTIIITLFDMVHDLEPKKVAINKDDILVISQNTDSILVTIASGNKYLVTSNDELGEIADLIEKTNGDFVKISGVYINITQFSELSSEGLITFRNGVTQEINFDETTSFESASTKINSALSTNKFAKSQTQR